MNKKGNTTAIIIIGIILVLLLIGITLFFIIPQMFAPSVGTAYSSYSVNDGETLTYSGLWKYESHQGITEKHYLSSECTQTAGCNFPIGVEQKGFFPFYLELNNIDSSQFHAGGNKPLVCVFQPNDWQNYAHQVWDESDKRYYWVTSDPTPPNIQELQSIGFSWDAWKSSCWVGNYQLSNLRTHTGKLICSVESDSYVAKGTVSVIDTGFVCSIDKSDIPTPTLSPTAKVKFRLAQEVTVFRFEYNQCTQLIVMENAKLSNDYNTLAECELNIEDECPTLNELDCESLGMIEVIETDEQGCQINFCKAEEDIEPDDIIVDDEEDVTVELNFFEKILHFFYKIGQWFKRIFT